MPRRLLLLGGGPAHARVLAAFAREPLRDADLALLTPDAHLVQPARLPDFVAGRLAADACRVDTAALAAAAGATWVRGRVEHFDPASRRVVLADGHSFDADLVSIDEPGAADRDALAGAREHALALHPATHFVALFDDLVALAAQRPLDLVVVGGGETGVEMALALAERLGGWQGRARWAGPALGQQPPQARIAWVAGPGELLSGWPDAARQALAASLAQARITVFREPCRALGPGAAVLASGARLACDAALLATPPQPAGWLRDSGLPLSEDGALQVTDRLQAASHPALLGPGPAGPAAGLNLAAQLRRALAAAPLPAVAPRAPALRWLRIGRGRAAVAWGGVVMTGLAPGLVLQQRSRRQAPRLLPAAPVPNRPAGS